MKKLNKSSLLLLCAGSLLGSAASAQIVADFNTPGQLASDFTKVGSGSLNEVTSGGLDNTGAVVPSEDGNDVRYYGNYSQAGNLDFSVSTYFQYETKSTDSRSLTIGFGTTNSQILPFGGNMPVGEAGAYVSLEGRNGDGTTNRLKLFYGNDGGGMTGKNGSTFSLVDSNWYFLELTGTYNSGDDTFDLESEIYNSDSIGNIGSFIDNRPQNGVDLSAFSASSDVYGFMGVPGDSGAGVAVVDNFTPVPEPATGAALLGAAAIMMVCFRRRARR